jgi:hypothetical protein
MSNTANRPPLNPTLRDSARHAATETRAEWLIGLDENVLALHDFLDEAARETNHPLRRVSLRQALLSAGFGSAAAKRIITLTLAFLEIPQHLRPKVVKIGFIVDARRDGRAALCLAEAINCEANRTSTLQLRGKLAGFPYNDLGLRK